MNGDTGNISQECTYRMVMNIQIVVPREMISWQIAGKSDNAIHLKPGPQTIINYLGYGALAFGLAIAVHLFQPIGDVQWPAIVALLAVGAWAPASLCYRRAVIRRNGDFLELSGMGVLARYSHELPLSTTCVSFSPVAYYATSDKYNRRQEGWCWELSFHQLGGQTIVWKVARTKGIHTNKYPPPGAKNIHEQVMKLTELPANDH